MALHKLFVGAAPDSLMIESRYNDPAPLQGPLTPQAQLVANVLGELSFAPETLATQPVLGEPAGQFRLRFETCGNVTPNLVGALYRAQQASMQAEGVRF